MARKKPKLINHKKLEQAAPDITRMLTEQVEPGLIGGPNLWCPLSMWYDHDRAEGVWESHPMTVEGQWLSLLLAGGRDEQRLRVELLDEAYG